MSKLKARISKSFHRNEDFFRKHADQIYILSNGFKEFIVPIVTEYGVKPNHVYANTFEFDEQDRIVGFDEDNILKDSIIYGTFYDLCTNLINSVSKN